MSVVLVTGMSGTGKSSVLLELQRRGHRVVDTDDPGWTVEVTDAHGEAEVVWDEARVTALLDGHTDGPLFLQGTVSNQGRFYARFDAVVLLSAPVEVLLERLATRTTNPYGRSEAERQEVVGYVQTVEPLLRRGATLEIDTRAPLLEVADRVERLALAGRVRRPVRRAGPWSVAPSADGFCRARRGRRAPGPVP